MHRTTTIISLVLIAQVISTAAFASIPPLPPTTTTTTTTTATARLRMLTRRTPQEVQLEIKDPVDPDALLQSRAILDELRSGGTSTSAGGDRCSSSALLAIARRYGDVPDDGASGYVVSPERCSEAYESLSSDERRTLLNIHARVKLVAEAQRNSVTDMEIDIPGGKAGQTVSPCRGECRSFAVLPPHLWFSDDVAPLLNIVHPPIFTYPRNEPAVNHQRTPCDDRPRASKNK